MSLKTHTLTVAGTKKSLADWGVRSAVMVHQLGGEDSLALEVSAETARSAFPFTAFQEVILRDPDGVKRFVGRMRRPRIAASGRSVGQSFVCVGPWSYLREITYQQEHKFPVDEEDISSLLKTEKTARVILHRHPTTGATVTLRGQVQAALDYAISEGAEIEYNMANVPNLQAPEDQAIDLQCGDVIRRELRWAPHIGCRWDYDGTKPKLVFGDTTAAGASGFGTATRAVAGLEVFEGELRDDLLVPEFEICYIWEHRAQAGGQTVRWKQVTRDISTVENDGFGRMVATVALRGGVWNGSAWDAPEPVPAAGLAAAIHAAYARPFFEMGWIENEETVNWSHQVGTQWNVTGAAAEAFADAVSVCQEVRREIHSGRTTLRCGPATFLGLADRIALLTPTRTKGMVKAAGSSQYGFEDPEADDGSSAGEELELQAIVMDGSTFRAGTVKVRGELVEP